MMLMSLLILMYADAVFCRIVISIPYIDSNASTISNMSEATTGVTTSEPPEVKCPRQCSCNEHSRSVSCIRRQLTFIPELPSWTKSFEFSGNQLVVVNHESFKNLSTLALHGLILANNSIVSLSNDSFMGKQFKTLQYLDLSYNKIAGDLVNVFKNSKFCLQHLILKSIGIDNTDKDGRRHFKTIYTALNHSKMNYLDLSGNNLVQWVWSKPLHINILVLNNCQLITFMYDNKMTNVSLKSNLLPRVDSYHNIQATSLEELDLYDNIVSFLYYNPAHKIFTSQNLPKLRTLRLDKNRINKMFSNMIDELPSLEMLSLSNQITPIQFDQYAFNSSSLLHLYIDTRVPYFFDNQDIRNMFRLVPKLQTLVMKSVDLSSDSDDYLSVLFEPLERLTYLDISNTNLGQLFPGFFKHFGRLTTLQLSENMLLHVNTDVFTAMDNLQHLYLDNNYIQTITSDFLSSGLMENLRTLDLHGNPFECTCDMAVFRDWLTDSPGKLGNSTTSDYHCTTSIPIRFQGKLIITYMPSYLDCHVIKPYIITGVCGLLTIMILITCLVVTYRKRWRIRYLCYLMKNTKGFEKLPEQTDLAFDIFVINDNGDAEWVSSQLQSYLHSSKIRKVCFHNRDRDTIPLFDEMGMNQSHKTLLIVSNGFMQHHGRVLDMVVSQLKSLHSDIKKNQVILIFLEEIQQENESDTLVYLAKSTPVLKHYAVETDTFWKELGAIIGKE